jgi:hypothetical protein
LRESLATTSLSSLLKLFAQLRSSEWGAYSYFSFLTKDTLVIPSLFQNILEIVRIVVDESNDDDVPLLVPLCRTLGLPPLSPHASIIRLGCCAEPNPTSSTPLLRPAPSSRPFRDNAAEAIVLFKLLIEDTNTRAAQFFRETRPFTPPRAHIPHAQRACVLFRSAPVPLRLLWHRGPRGSSPRHASSNSTLRRCARSRRPPRTARGHDGGARTNTHHSARL